MIGALGNDTYYVDDAGDQILEIASISDGTTTWSNASVDTVIATVSYRLGGPIEQLVLAGSSPIDGTGNALANVLTGNAAANVLDGGAGADTMIGGGGDDTYVVDNVGDVISESPGEGIDLVTASISYTLGANLENLTLTGTAAAAIGNAGSNILTRKRGREHARRQGRCRHDDRRCRQRHLYRRRRR